MKRTFPKHSKKGLISIVGVTAASLLFCLIPKYEGEVLTTYKDPVGILTVCYGDTDKKLAVEGASYSREECLRSLEKQLISHAEGVLSCTPILKDYPEQLAAAVSLAYNIGTTAYCSSTVARRFNAGDFSGACGAFSMWVKVKGKTLQGLVNRRKDEAALCRRNLPQKPPTRADPHN